MVIERHGHMSDHVVYVLEGEVTMDYENHAPVTFGAGELVVVPRGVVHRPRAESEVKVLLIEPKGEPNSGDADVPPAPKPHI